MKKQRKKLQLMTALMLGTTVFLPAKKALGMIGNTEEDARSIGTTTYKATAAKQVLAGDIFVNSTLSLDAKVVLRHLNGLPVIKDMLADSLQALYVGGIGKVMAHDSTFKPDLSNEELKALIKQGLQKISSAQDDPFDSVVTKQVYTSWGQNDRKAELDSIMGDKSAIQRIFAEKLSHVMEETPNILNSFLAHLPQSEAEKEAQNLCTEKFAHYFTALNVVDGWTPTAPTLSYKQKQLLANPHVEYELQLKEAAKVYSTLLQREKKLLTSRPSPESETVSAPSSYTRPESQFPGQSGMLEELSGALAKRRQAPQITGSSSPSLRSTSTTPVAQASAPTSSLSPVKTLSTSLQERDIVTSSPTSSSSSMPSTKPATLVPADEPALLENTPRYHMGKISPYPLSGFSAPEGAHRWTVGKKATITLPLAEMGFPSQISFFDTRALVTGSHPQHLIVKVNGEGAGSYDYTLTNNNQTIEIPLPEAGSAEIEFEMPNAASPSDLGISADTRALGISFREFQAYSTPRYHMGKVSPYPLSGFSTLESSHRWTVGKKATITLPLEVMAHRPSRISFLNTKGFVTGSHPQNLTVKVNGKEAGRYIYTPGNNNHTLEIPLPKDGPATIEFEIPYAISPSALGINADQRELGISFGEVELQ
ncbi:MAG: hypothetical protein K2X02_03110 [Alphaproteobacteria bacterium]|nr:hypothetical protein [Alphaproteobacteria bacterium]